ncbi:MAG: site-2 protease family protein [Deltaproteobacteria bacterium]|nr:site-2 protease family protein [Deltaproteobacteria bacterium]
MITAIVAFIIVFSVVVVVHELGHYIAAKRAGIKVYEFSLGFPFSPRLITLFRLGETEFTVRLLPLGGFVRFSKDGSDDGAEYFAASAGSRALTAFSGPLFNLAFAAICFFTVFAFYKGMDVFHAGAASVEMVWRIVQGTFAALAGVFGAEGGASSIAGPIGIAAMAKAALSKGAYEFLFFTGLLSASLGIMNLLPLPMLDGGQLVLIAVEKIGKRPVPEKVYAVVAVAGIILFAVITALTVLLDVGRLIA